MNCLINIRVLSLLVKTILLIVCDTAFYAIIVLNTLSIKLIALIADYKTLEKYQISALKINFSSDSAIALEKMVRKRTSWRPLLVLMDVPQVDCIN